MSDFPDWTAGATLVYGSVADMAGKDFPDWTDGVTVVSTPLGPGVDLPDWTKAVSQVAGTGVPTHQSTGGMIAVNSTSITPSFGAATPAGALLVGVITAASGGGIGNPVCTDPTWTRAVSDHGAGFGWAAVWYKQDSNSNETAPTWQSSAAQWMTAALLVFTGMDTVAPADVTAANVTPVSQVATATATMGVADQYPRELVVMSASLVNFGTTATFTDVYNNGTPVNIGSLVPAANYAAHAAYATNSGNGAPDSWTVSWGPVLGWPVVAIASFKGA